MADTWQIKLMREGWTLVSDAAQLVRTWFRPNAPSVEPDDAVLENEIRFW